MVKYETTTFNIQHDSIGYTTMMWDRNEIIIQTVFPIFLSETNVFDSVSYVLRGWNRVWSFIVCHYVLNRFPVCFAIIDIIIYCIFYICKRFKSIYYISKFIKPFYLWISVQYFFVCPCMLWIENYVVLNIMLLYSRCLL